MDKPITLDGKLRCLQSLLQQLGADAACDAVSEARDAITQHGKPITSESAPIICESAPLIFESQQGEPVAIVGEGGSVSWRSERILAVGAPLYAGPPAQNAQGEEATGPKHGDRHDGCTGFWCDVVEAEYKKPGRALGDESNVERYIRIGLMCDKCGAERPAHAERARVPVSREALEGLKLVPASMLAEAVQVLRNMDTELRATGRCSARIERLVNALSPLATAPSQPEDADNSTRAKTVVHWPRNIGKTSAQLAALRGALQLYPSRNTHQLQAAKVCAGVARLADELLAVRAAEVTHG